LSAKAPAPKVRVAAQAAISKASSSSLKRKL
jgi:hypothetical protein